MGGSPSWQRAGGRLGFPGLAGRREDTPAHPCPRTRVRRRVPLCGLLPSFPPGLVTSGDRDPGHCQTQKPPRAGPRRSLPSPLSFGRGLRGGEVFGPLYLAEAVETFSKLAGKGFAADGCLCSARLDWSSPKRTVSAEAPLQSVKCRWLGRQAFTTMQGRNLSSPLVSSLAIIGN